MIEFFRVQVRVRSPDGKCDKKYYNFAVVMLVGFSKIQLYREGLDFSYL